MDWNEFFFRHVYLVASKSKDPRTKIGAVLVKDNVIISEGYNGFPRGVEDLDSRYSDRETKYKYIVHSEHNAILNCVRNGISTLGSILYTQGIPCDSCAKACIQSGVNIIYVHAQWPDLMYSEKWVESYKITETMFKEVGIEVRKFNKILGVKGFLDGKEIEV